jgi:hypothetical protein
MLHHLARRARTALAVCLVAVGLSVGAADPAGAVDNGEWAVVPTSEGGITSRSSFVFDLDPGARLEDSVTIENLTEETIRFRLYAADAFNPDTGGVAVAGPETAPSGAASWITLATNELELPGRTRAQVPFSVTIPVDATPGDHAAGIAALDIDAEEREQEGDVRVDVQNAVAAPLFVRVNGDLRPSVVVSGISVDRGSSMPGGDRGTDVTVTVTNDGNVRVSPQVVVSVGGLGASGVPTAPVMLNNLLPGSSRTVTVDAGDGPVLGPGTVDVVVAADGITIERTESFWTAPWVVSVVLVLVAGVILAWRRRRRRRRQRAGAPLEAKVLVSAGS